MITSSLHRWSLLCLPWSGLVGGVLGWGLQHQLGTYIATIQCITAAHAVIAIGCIGALLASAGGLVSLQRWKRSPIDVHRVGWSTQRFIAALSATAAILFLGTIVLQTAASLVIPACAA
jgi:hypothetical protein